MAMVALGSVVQVHQFVREGALVRERWRGAIVIDIDDRLRQFTVEFLDDRNQLVLSFDRRNEAWR
jgi:hypothetical protein